MAVLGLLGILSVIPCMSGVAANAPALEIQDAVANERVFEIPLSPAFGMPPFEESRDLYSSLEAFKPLAAKEDCSPLTHFLAKYPSSPYAGSLWLDLGLLRLKEGYYTRATYCLERAWSVLKNADSVDGKAAGDRTLGELALLEAHSGAGKKLAKLLAEAKGRPVHGSATQRLAVAKQILADYKKAPGLLSACATDSLMIMGNLEHKKLPDSSDVLATSSETSLLKLSEMAAKEGLRLTPVRKSPQARLVTPIVAHLKLGHYAVVTGVKGGFVQMDDPSFGGNISVSQKAFQEESSGYFLTPAAHMERGWSRVDSKTAAGIMGAGPVSDTDDSDTGDDSDDTDPCDEYDGLTHYNIQAMLCSLKLSDTPVGYDAAVGPSVECKVSYSHKEFNDLPAKSTNFGPKWRFQFCSYVQDDPANTNLIPTVFMGGGGYEQNQLGVADERTGAVLTQTSLNPISYTRTFPDGTQQIYSQSDGGTTTRNVYLTRINDPQGLALILTYSTSGGIRLTKITDGFARNTTFTYGFAPDPFKVTKITDPYGRSATFTYQATAPFHLLSITDVLGITSSYVYEAGTDFITTLTTPYGTSTFATSDTSPDPTNTSNWLEATDPLGHTERAEFEGNLQVTPNSDPYGPTVPGVSILNAYLNYRNTYYWDKLSYPSYGSGTAPDYSKAKIFHWLHLDGGSGTTSGILESIKEPLENRIWFLYGNQTGASNTSNVGMIGKQPAIVARGLENGETSSTQSTVNALGFPTQSTDAVGRTTLYTYAANNQDLLSVKVAGAGSTKYTVWQGSSYYKHRPEIIIDPNGGKYLITYNAYALPTSVTNPLNQKTTYVYDAKIRLIEVEGPASEVLARYTYDSFDRVATVTDALGQTKTFTYDAANHVLSVAYQDGTKDSYTYNLLDLSSHTDRQGRVTSYVFNPLRQLIEKTDAAGHSTDYSWCLCGHLGGFTDANGHGTTLWHDIEGRLVKRTYADGSFEVRTYEPDTNWVQTVTDAKGQTKVYNYNADGSLSGAEYLDDTIATPSVSFSYDPYFPRISAVSDGSGTKTYAYQAYGLPGGGRLSSVVEPGFDTITLAYDALARVESVQAGADKETRTYDDLGRVSSDANPLGTFVYDYLGNSKMPTTISGGPIKSTFAYDSLPEEIRVKSLENEAGSTVLDDFGYTYNPTGTIATWSSSYDSGVNVGSATATYDPTNKLTAWTVKDPANAVLADQTFTYDALGNRETSSSSGVAATYATNSVNQYLSESLPAAHESYAYAYDANGSLADVGFTDTASPSLNYKDGFVYDGENRLVRFASGTHESAFYYNAQNRVIKISEYSGGSLVSNVAYLWLGSHLLEEKTGTGTKHFYPQGVVEATGEKLYYTRDHLGSIREVAESTGVVVAKYQYDPFGVTTQVSGSYVSDLGFDGYLKHGPSGLLLAPNRAYAPRIGRWLSRDPVFERGGINIYGFVGNNPLRETDPSGLTPLGSMGGIVNYSSLKVSTRNQISSLEGRHMRQKHLQFAGPSDPDGPEEVDDPPLIYDDPGDSDISDDPYDQSQYDDSWDDDSSYDSDSCLLDPTQYWSDRGVEVYYPEIDDELGSDEDTNPDPDIDCDNSDDNGGWDSSWGGEY